MKATVPRGDPALVHSSSHNQAQQDEQQAQHLSTEKEIASSKLREEVAAIRLELSAKDALIVEAKQDTKAEMNKVVSKLKQQLADAEVEKDEALDKAAAVAEDSVEKAELKKLQKEIKKKDARIKKLEDVKREFISLVNACYFVAIVEVINCAHIICKTNACHHSPSSSFSIISYKGTGAGS